MKAKILFSEHDGSRLRRIVLQSEDGNRQADAVILSENPDAEIKKLVADVNKVVIPLPSIIRKYEANRIVNVDSNEIITVEEPMIPIEEPIP